MVARLFAFFIFILFFVLNFLGEAGKARLKMLDFLACLVAFATRLQALSMCFKRSKLKNSIGSEGEHLIHAICCSGSERATVERIVILFLTPLMLGGEGGIGPFCHVVHAPIEAIDVDVYKRADGRKVPRRQLRSPSELILDLLIIACSA